MNIELEATVSLWSKNYYIYQLYDYFHDLEFMLLLMALQSAVPAAVSHFFEASARY